jgi:hypothetical protein
MNNSYINKTFNLKEENLYEQENFTNFLEENLRKNKIKIQQALISEEIKSNYQKEEGKLNIIEAIFNTNTNNNIKYIDNIDISLNDDFSPQKRKTTLQKFHEIGNRYSFTENENPLINNINNLFDINNSDKKIKEENFNLTENLIKENHNENNYNNIDNKEKEKEIKIEKEKEINKEIEKEIKINIDPALKKENDEVYKILSEKQADIDSFLNRNEWKVLEDTKDGYKAFYIDEKSGFRSIKSSIIIEKNVDFLNNYILDVEKRGKYDHNFDYGNTLRIIDDNHTIGYLKFKGKFMISSRDFVVCRKVIKVIQLKILYIFYFILFYLE